MHGLTTIAALPTAAGCKAELTADKAKANAPTFATGGFVMSMDLATKPDRTGVAFARMGTVVNSFTVGHVATLSQVRQAVQAAMVRHKASSRSLGL